MWQKLTGALLLGENWQKVRPAPVFVQCRFVRLGSWGSLAAVYRAVNIFREWCPSAHNGISGTVYIVHIQLLLLLLRAPNHVGRVAVHAFIAPHDEVGGGGQSRHGARRDRLLSPPLVLPAVGGLLRREEPPRRPRGGLPEEQHGPLRLPRTPDPPRGHLQRLHGRDQHHTKRHG